MDAYRNLMQEREDLIEVKCIFLKVSVRTQKLARESFVGTLIWIKFELLKLIRLEANIGLTFKIQKWLVHDRVDKAFQQRWDEPVTVGRGIKHGKGMYAEGPWGQDQEQFVMLFQVPLQE